MLLNASRSFLLVIDIQSRLAPVIHQGASIINHTCWLMQIARELQVPIRVTEQYPRGIGSSVAPIKELFQPEELIQKMHFGALFEPEIKANLATLERKQVVVTGTEAHVCVLQTVIGLIEAGYEVYLVEEALGSRKPQDKLLALQRMQQLGAQVVSREMVAFEWLHKAGTDTFRKLVQNYIK